MGKLLALDLGSKRVGYAVSDVDQTMAFPRESIPAVPTDAFFRAVQSITETEQIEKLIIGLPLDEENEEGEAAQKIRAIGTQLAEFVKRPVEFVDESGSTNEAMRRIPLRKHRREKGFRDAIAAQIILERYLGQM